MAEITSLTTVSKTNIDINDYLLVANKSTKKARKLAAQSLCPALFTLGSSSESLYTSITNGNQINFKGLKSSDTTKLTVTTTDDNLVLALVESGIDLSNCDNSVSKFLTETSLSRASGTLIPANGGTGLTTIAKGSVLYGSSLDTLSTTTLAADGQLLIGSTSLGIPSASTLTAGTGISITNGSGSITIAATSITTLSSALDCSTYNINLNDSAGDSFLSGDGTSEGVHVDSDGRVFIGNGTPTLPTLSGQCTIGGTATNALDIGNVNHYGDRVINMINSPSGTAGANLSILGADATGGNTAGGSITVTAGSGIGTANGGDVTLHAGNHANSGSSSPGDVYIKTYSDSKASQTNATFTDDLRTTFNGPIICNNISGVKTADFTRDNTEPYDHYPINTTSAQIDIAMNNTNAATGQTCTFTIVVDGGNNCVITPGTFTGGSTWTGADVGDSVTFQYVGATYQWVCTSNQGGTIA
jgi:hypothetical protein